MSKFSPSFQPVIYFDFYQLFAPVKLDLLMHSHGGLIAQKFDNNFLFLKAQTQCQKSFILLNLSVKNQILQRYLYLFSQ